MITKWFRAFKRASTPFRPSLFEEIFLCTFRWRVPYWVEFRRFEKLLSTYGEDSIPVRKQQERLRLAEYAVRYGRAIKPEKKESIDKHIKRGVSHRSIRSLVINNLLRSDGKLYLSKWKEWTILLLGAIFFSLLAIYFLHVNLVFWSVVVGPLAKVIATSIYLAVFLYGFLVFHYFSFRPFSATRWI